MTVISLKKGANDKWCLHELRGGLPPVVYNYVRGYKNNQEILNTLMENFYGNEWTKTSFMTQYLSELSEIKKKESESIKFYNDRIWFTNVEGTMLFNRFSNSTVNPFKV